MSHAQLSKARTGWVVIVAALAGTAGAALLQRGTVRLNGPLARPTVASLHEAEAVLTPDGSRVLYMGDLDSEDVVELFASPTDGSGGALRLNGPIVAGGDVRDFQLTPDGTQVVYRADQEQDGDTELYAVPIDGSRMPVRISGRLVAGGDVDRFLIHPGGRWVVYLADQLADEVRELFAVPIDRTIPPVRVSGPLVMGGDVRDFRISPDGAYLVYLADQIVNEVIELFSRSAVQPPIRLNPPLSLGADVGAFTHGFDFSLDGSRVLYLADQDTNDRVELYSVPIDASAPAVRLNGPLAFGSVPTSFVVAPDGTHVVYVASELGTGGCQVYAASINGSTPNTRLGELLNSLPSVVKIGVDPTSTRVVYLGEGNTFNVSELYSAPIDGSFPAVRLNPALVSGGVSEFLIAGDGQHGAFRMQDGFAGHAELFAVPLDGSQPAWRLNAPLPVGAEVASPLLLAPVVDRVVYLADQLTLDVLELFSVPIDGSAAPVRLSGTLTLGADVHTLQVSRDGRLVLYRADQELHTVDELYAVPTDASTPAVRVNDPLQPGPVTGDVGAFALSPDGATVVYAASQDGDDSYGLYGVPIDRATRPVALHEDRPDGVYAPVLAFAITPDGQQVVHARTQFGAVGLFAGLLDGSQPPELLAWLSGVPVLSSIEVSADGEWGLFSQRFSSGFTSGTLFRVDGTVSPQTIGQNGNLHFFDSTSSFIVYRQATFGGDLELFSTRLDGTGTIVRLDGLLVPGRTVASAAITPDGGSVLYVADQEVDELFELYRVPIDGSAPPFKLSAGAVGGGVSVGLAVTSDSLHVIYRQQTVAGFRLLRANVDGSGTPLDLAPSATNVKELSTQGRLVFLDDAGVGTALRLFSVFSDGSAAPLDLSGALAPGGAISSFKLSADGMWAVYLADQDVPGQSELFAVPLDGSRSRVRISAAPMLGSEILRYEIAPYSTRVAYLLGDSGLGTAHLFRVPIDGSRAPIGIDEQGGPASAVTDFHFASDSRTIVFRADQQEDEVFELFARISGHEPRSQDTPATTVSRAQ